MNEVKNRYPVPLDDGHKHQTAVAYIKQQRQKLDNIDQKYFIVALTVAFVYLKMFLQQFNIRMVRRFVNDE